MPIKHGGLTAILISIDGNVSLSMFTIDGRIPFLSNGYPTSMIGQSSLVDEGECGQIVKNSYGSSVASEVSSRYL